MRRTTHARRTGRVGRFLLPAGDGDVIRFFLRNLYVAHGARMRARRLLIPLMPGPVRDRLLFATAGLDGETGSTLLERADSAAAQVIDDVAGLAGRVDRRIVVADASIHARDRLVFFLFGDRDRPEAVLKIRPLDASGRPLHAEWLALQHLRRFDRLAGTVPNPLSFLRTDDLEVLAISALPGTSAYVDMRGRVAPERRAKLHFSLAADWLARFHMATRTAEEAATVDRSGIGAGKPSRALESQGQPVRRSCGHGDFWAHNLLLRKHGVLPGVVDWEHFAVEAPCFVDLFHFPFTYGLNYRWRQAGLEAFRSTFLEESALSNAVREYFRRYCVAADLDPAALPALLRMFLRLRDESEPSRTVRGVSGADCRRLLDLTRRPAFLP